MLALLKKFENLWVAITFAEAGEHETSQDYLIADLDYEIETDICHVI